jgi:hypothetical protein
LGVAAKYQVLLFPSLANRLAARHGEYRSIPSVGIATKIAIAAPTKLTERARPASLGDRLKTLSKFRIWLMVKPMLELSLRS